MHCLSIVFDAGAPVMWKLVFRDGEAAEKAAAHISEARAGWYGAHPAPVVQLTDDFGQRVTIDCGNFTACMLENLEESKLAHIEMSLHEARVRSKANQMAQADPGIRQAAIMQGPAVLSPSMFNGRA